MNIVTNVVAWLQLHSASLLPIFCAAVLGYVISTNAERKGRLAELRRAIEREEKRPPLSDLEREAFQAGHAAGFKTGWESCYNAFSDEEPDPEPDEAPIEEDGEPSGTFVAATFEKIESSTKPPPTSHVPVPRKNQT